METFYRIWWLSIFACLLLFHDKAKLVSDNVYDQNTWFGLLAALLLLPSFVVFVINFVDFVEERSLKNGVWALVPATFTVLAFAGFIRRDAGGECVLLFFVLAFFVGSILGVLWNDSWQDGFKSIVFRSIVGHPDQSGITYIGTAEERNMKRARRLQRDEQLLFGQLPSSTDILRRLDDSEARYSSPRR